MLLALDIGNTEVTVGLFSHDELVGHWRLTTSSDRTPDEWGAAIEAFLVRAGHSPAEIRAACLASVAPGVTQALLHAVRDAITVHVGLVTPMAKLPIVLDVDEPLTVGADRIANVLGALALYPGASVVVDFGTATTFDCVTADRHFIGGSIMPGLRTSAEQLVRKAAKLTATELVAPARAIGRRTDENIQGGVLFGAADAVDGMITRIRREWPGGERPRVIATGGLATLIAPLASSIDVVNPDLTLHGLRVAAAALGLPA
ncbi:MAG TPA: type III pantothenate kinase [Gemmatimonadales bacterium]|jgi:type III pantothenate kinase|nr:type III pantothenate kinase [Gemmatimonadales bacterium]